MTTYLIIGAVWAIINAVVLVAAARLGCGGFIDAIVNDMPCKYLILMFVIMALLWPVWIVTNAIVLIKNLIKKRVEL